jgi:ribosome-binding factor A
MAQGNRPERIGEEILQELGTLLVREVKDPGIGFVTLTRTKVSPDLQLVRVYYTLIGDEKAKRETQKALERATPFLRRQIGSRVRLRRVPELRFEFDKSVEHQDRIERILLDLEQERQSRAADRDSSAAEPAAEDEATPQSSDETRSPGKRS